MKYKYSLSHIETYISGDFDDNWHAYIFVSLSEALEHSSHIIKEIKERERKEKDVSLWHHIVWIEEIETKKTIAEMESDMNRTLKVFIDFLEDRYKEDFKAWKDKQAKGKEVEDEAKRLLGTDALPSDFLDDAVTKFYALLAEKHKEENTLNLSGWKLAEVLEIDLTMLKLLWQKYCNVRDVKKPVKSEYEVYAENNDELDRLITAQKLMEAVDLFQDRGVYVNYRQLLSAVQGRPVIIDYKGQFKININFVKNN